MNKNILKVPPNVLTNLKSIKSNQIVAACVHAFGTDDIKKGSLAHLSIDITEKGLIFPKSVIPIPESGKYSYRNLHGQEIVRKDLPLETHYNTIESPDWGDWSRGSHTINLPYEKYPRDFIAPRQAEILIECPDPSAGKTSYVIKFEVAETLDKKNKDFNERLLFCLNLLTENVGYFGVEAAGTPMSEYIKTLRVSWELLPPGTKEEAMERLTRGSHLSDEEKKDITERYDYLMSLKPNKLIYGTSGLQRYFGALIKDDLVVFENIEYGNAIYVMFENWKDLSQRTRIELLSGRFGNNFNRVIHRRGWKKQVKEIIKERK